jgi:uncharacterized protein (TIGR02145 family)
MRTFSIICILVFATIFLIGCKKDDNKFTMPPPVFNHYLTYGSMTDQDGNVYRSITIGSQSWMAENLRTTHYRNGQVIPEITDSIKWRKLKTGAYCDYNNSSLNSVTLGKLYNGFAVNDSRNIAPAGWHIPSDTEWKTLIEYLGGENIAGGKLKETGAIHWASPNEWATNESGFTALPYGMREESGNFNLMSMSAWFWSSTEYTENYYESALYTQSLCNYCMNIYRYFDVNTEGLSVRCIRD